MICIAKYRRTNNNDRHDIISILNTDKERPISLSVWKTIRNLYVMDAVDENVEQTDDTETSDARIEENLPRSVGLVKKLRFPTYTASLPKARYPAD